jgi:tetratricopeptide (TPR) repeat protein
MLPSYKDPLFSILLIITLMLVTALITYVWGIYSQNRKKESLISFLEKFDGMETILDNQVIHFNAKMIKPLQILAQAFESSGEYHKAIDIYLYLIKNSDQSLSKKDMLEKLGELYLRAGFLERSQKIFLEILKEYPRSREALHHLAIVYELLHQYDKALEVLKPLEILGEDIEALWAYLEFELFIHTPKLSLLEKTATLQSMLLSRPSLYRNIIEYLFKYNPSQAWQLIDLSKIDEIVDILWMLPKSKLDLDIIYTSDCLQAIYYLKGHVAASKPCKIFHIELLASAKRSGMESGDLIFSYRCKKCQHAFPISFSRCPSCMNINSIKIEGNIAKKQQQTSDSLL